MKRTALSAASLLVCVITPAQASVIFTLTFGPATSVFSGTTYSASTFSFTALDIPPFPSGGSSGYILGTSDGITSPYGGDFTGATLNGLPITNLSVLFRTIGGVNYADLSFFTDAVLPVGALGGFDNFEVPLGLSTDLVLGSYDAAFGGADRFESDGCQGPGNQNCAFMPGAQSAASLTIAKAPEPSSLPLAATGLIALAFLRKRTGKA